MFLRSMFVLFLSCLSVNTLGQSLTVSGTVTDEKGEPIIGASVLVIGTTNGSITNFDGIFYSQQCSIQCSNYNFLYWNEKSDIER